MKLHVAKVYPVVDPGMRLLCTKRYPNHPHGCPNYGEYDSCPPKCGMLGDVFDLEKPFWVLWTAFNLEAHVSRMREKQPKWTYRQLSCCLYWQGTVRKYLREESEEWMQRAKTAFPDHMDKLRLITCPEAMGVNVTATMKSIGVKLEWPPKKKTRMIYLVGVEK